MSAAADVPSKKKAAATVAAIDPRTNAKATAEEDKEAEALPLIAQLINHMLTPGSSLTGTVWICFNIIIAILGFIWLFFLIQFPDNWHLWVFGFLGGGLAASTNFLMYQIIFGLTEEERAQIQADMKKARGGDATTAAIADASAGTDDTTAPAPAAETAAVKEPTKAEEGAVVGEAAPAEPVAVASPSGGMRRRQPARKE